MFKNTYYQKMSNGEVSEESQDSKVTTETTKKNIDNEKIKINKIDEDDGERYKFNDSIESQNKSTVSLSKENNIEFNYGFQNSKLVLNENKFDQDEVDNIQMVNMENKNDHEQKFNSEFEKDNESYLNEINKSISQSALEYQNYSDFNMQVNKS